MRLLVAVEKLAKGLDDGGFLVWARRPSPEQLAKLHWGESYSRELADYLLHNLRHNSRQMSAKSKPGPHSGKSRNSEFEFV